MRSRALAISVLSILLFSSLGILVSGDSDGRSIVRQRDSTHSFSWQGSATTVEVMGEWNNWTTGTSLIEETPPEIITGNLDISAILTVSSKLGLALVPSLLISV